MSGRIIDVITAYGHPNITAKHKTTLMITKCVNIGKDADCVIAVKADKACCDLKKNLKDALLSGREVEMVIGIDGVADKVKFIGSSELKSNHRNDIVVRKSSFIDDRTLGILADKAACDLKMEVVDKLKDTKNRFKITLIAK